MITIAKGTVEREVACTDLQVVTVVITVMLGTRPVILPGSQEVTRFSGHLSTR